MKAVFITECGTKIGLGHLGRCIALYNEFRSQGVNTELIVNSSTSISKVLKGKVYKCFNWQKESKKLFNTVKNYDFIIIDSYLADQCFYKKIANSSNALLIYIDDNNRLDYPKGLLVNVNIYAKSLNYKRDRELTYLLGSKYAILRSEFRNISAKRIRNAIESIMITYGGNDIRNMTVKTIETLNSYFPQIKKNVIVGPLYKNKNRFKNYNFGNTKIFFCPDARKMLKIMIESDITVSASGQTLYELARVGVPTVAVTVADNQVRNVKGLSKARFIKDAGLWDEKDVYKNIVKRINELERKHVRLEMRNIGRTIVDGKGPVRIVKKAISLRKNIGA